MGISLPEMLKEANLGEKRAEPRSLCMPSWAWLSEVGWDQLIAPPCNVLQHSSGKAKTHGEACPGIVHFYLIRFFFISSTSAWCWKPASLHGPPCRWDLRLWGRSVRLEAAACGWRCSGWLCDAAFEKQARWDGEMPGEALVIGVSSACASEAALGVAAALAAALGLVF